ncbi:MAG: hypothetical protein M3409_02185 [Gemmatimonadota bacterium]|nr:hypothetical protein [Gemmatimonadota bacterium]
MRRTACLSVLSLGALLAAACGDPTGSAFDPVIATDTVQIAPPSAEAGALPSAVDLSIAGGVFGGINGPTRFPERSADASAGWDLTVRSTSGGLVFFPAGALGLSFNSGISPRAEAFESIERAPEMLAEYVTDAAVPLAVGSVYVARTRQRGGCVQYSKLRVLEIGAGDAVRLEIVGNERCTDPRLVPRQR